jgi:hypothetical protein
MSTTDSSVIMKTAAARAPPMLPRPPRMTMASSREIRS